MSPRMRWAIAVGRRGALALAGFVVTVMIAGDKYNVFDLTNKQLFRAATALALLVLIDQLLSLLRTVKTRGREAAYARVQKALTALLAGISDEHKVPIQHLGANVFVPRLRLVGTGKRLRRPRRVLVRVIRFRLDNHPQPTAVTWLPTKGAIGKCWARKRTVHRDWHGQADRHGDHDLTKDEFEQISVDDRDGFTFEEFVAIARKYNEALAVPVLSEAGAVLGVISIDVAYRAQKPCILDGDAIEAQADTTATVVRDDIAQIYTQG